MEISARTLAAGFVFPEGPRWHDGKLWFADQHDCKVHVLNPDGTPVESFAVAGRPSGMGWLPDGDLLVVSMMERKLFRRRNGQLTLHADLAGIHPGHSNDMVVDQAGRAFVGNIGFDFHAGEEFRPTVMTLVMPDGKVSIVAENIACPNGPVITADGERLILAESYGNCLTEYDIADDGKLINRRLFADLKGCMPDGICLDAEECIWVAAPFVNAVLRVGRGGDVVDTVSIANGAPYACMLGGADGHDLFVCCATDHAPEMTVRLREGRIDLARAPGAQGRLAMSGVEQLDPPGISQPVRCGAWSTVSGQVALKHGKVVGVGDPAAQARQCFDNIAAVLAEAGASLGDIVSLRCYLTDKSAYPGYAEEKSMLFKDESPASTTVIISALLIPDLLMEVEAVAWSGQLKSNY